MSHAPYSGGPASGAPYQGAPGSGAPYQGAPAPGAPYQGAPAPGQHQGAPSARPYQGAPGAGASFAGEQARPVASDPEVRAERESLGELISSVSDHISELMRKEVELAKAELTESAKHAGKSGGLFAGAGVAGHMALLFLSLTIMFALGTFMDLLWAALIVTVIWAIAAAVLAFVGKSEVDKVKGAPQTAETLSQIPNTLTPTPEARR